MAKQEYSDRTSLQAAPTQPLFIKGQCFILPYRIPFRLPANSSVSVGTWMPFLLPSLSDLSTLLPSGELPLWAGNSPYA